MLASPAVDRSHDHGSMGPRRDHGVELGPHAHIHTPGVHWSHLHAPPRPPVDARFAGLALPTNHSLRWPSTEDDAASAGYSVAQSTLPPTPPPPPSPPKSQSEAFCAMLREAFTSIVDRWRQSKWGRGVIDYWTLHMLFLAILALAGAIALVVINWGNMTFIDALFLAMSSVTVTGLTTFDFATVNPGTTVVCYLLMSLGSTIVLSIPPVILRRFLYRQSEDPAKDASRGRQHRAMLGGTVSRTFMSFAGSQFSLGLESTVDGADAGGEHSGGHRIKSRTEYDAAGMLLSIYLTYIIGVQAMGVILLGAHAAWNLEMRAIILGQGLNPWAWAVFHTSSCFYNVGLSLLPNSLSLLQYDNYVLVISCLLLAVGNCLFPVMLRWIIVALHRYGRLRGRPRRALRFLIRNPRRASIHLFPDKETWFLLLTWVAILFFQVIGLLVFDFHNPNFATLTQLKRVGLLVFQSVSNRTGGFFIMTIDSYSPFMILIAILFMWADSYPLLFTIGKTGAIAQVKASAATHHHHRAHGPYGTTTTALLPPTETDERPAPRNFAPTVSRATATATTSPTSLPRRISSKSTTYATTVGRYRSSGVATPARARSESGRSVAVSPAIHVSPGSPTGIRRNANGTGTRAAMMGSMVSVRSAVASVVEGARAHAASAFVLFDGGPGSGGAPVEATSARVPPPPPTRAPAGIQQWLVSDMRWIYAAMAVIVGSESIRVGGGMTLASFDVFLLLFECVSAYGTVGLSLGRSQAANDSATLAGTLGPFARFILVVLMLVGRARSVPNTIDYSFAQPELEKSVETEPVPHTNANVKMSAILAPLIAHLPGLNLPHAESTNDAEDEPGAGGGLKPPLSPGGLSAGGFSLLSPVVSVAGLHPSGGPAGSAFAKPMASTNLGPQSPPPALAPTPAAPRPAPPSTISISSTTPRSSRSSVTTSAAAARHRSAGAVPAIVVGVAARSLESVRANARARSPLAQYVATAELDDDEDGDEDGGSSSPCEDQDRLVVAGGRGRGRRRRSSRSEPSLLAARTAAVASAGASAKAAADEVDVSPGSSIADVDEVEEEEPKARVHGTNSSLGPLPSETAATMVVPVETVRPRSVSDGNARRVLVPPGVRRGHRPPDECG
ncbi:hypothetical protein AMAG_06809 [Allomyces macrogynus ATCC 38327]|uniref:Potassium transport protein n=1 Tax=Allomyces macrogynus (strain ATCC 38327) TaxID=578462 RepID=A0A0L0SF44_ALLM3|nr:hypothetical protein AMAG_06809 [Allomyces macrogynus ATCC 38327]|eukprot:KNE61054.1 hypothetical protein AMAG_06809 [Allomyces macrogynus ATCC 38327]